MAVERLYSARTLPDNLSPSLAAQQAVKSPCCGNTPTTPPLNQSQLAQTPKDLQDLLNMIQTLMSALPSGSINSAGPISQSSGLGLSQPFSSEAFAQTINSVLKPDAQGNIHEEQFQHGITTFLLQQLNPQAATRYQKEFDAMIGQGGRSFEDTVKSALGRVVEAGLITREQAERVNGASFKAAQLDANLDTLYDGKGGPGDSTIAVMNISDAIKKAAAILTAMDSGEESFSTRPLDAPSNVKAPVAGASVSASGSSGGGISQAFLWKPVSEKDGKLVVLLPAKYRGQVESIGVYSALPPSAQTLVEKGRHTGGGNGGRDHFRFNKSGGGYPDGCYVVATLRDGRQIDYKIGDSGSRNEKV